jgi:hypothetical protein
MAPPKLIAVNDAGVEFQLLTPFFEAILPAFESKADEIRVEPHRSGLRVTCCDEGLVVPLPRSPRNYAAMAFPRILILAKMSIALEGAEQSGSFRLRYDDRFIAVHVLGRRDPDKWVLTFRPVWDQAEPVVRD